MNVIKNIVPFFILSFVFTLAPVAYAQSIIPEIPSTLSFSVTPESPRPKEEVLISIKSFSINLPSSSIKWYENGARIDSGTDKTEIKISAGELGEQQVISVILQTPEGSVFRDELVLRPVEIALLWEADTYTSPFFRGRALPSQGSNIRAEARATFMRQDGSVIDDGDLEFTWKLGSRVLKDISGQGRSSVQIEIPQFFAEDILSVEIISTDNLYKGKAIARIPATEPYLTLYEDSPLLGILFHDAITGEKSISDTETTVAAFPYYMSIANPFSEQISYNWQVVDERIVEDPQDPFRIILQVTKEFTGTIPLSLSVSHIDNVLQSTNRTWFFSNTKNTSPVQDPFSRKIN